MHLLESMQQKLDGTPVELPPISLPQEVPLLPAGADQLGPVERAEVAVRLQERWGMSWTRTLLYFASPCPGPVAAGSPCPGPVMDPAPAWAASHV